MITASKLIFLGKHVNKLNSLNKVNSLNSTPVLCPPGLNKNTPTGPSWANEGSHHNPHYLN